MVGLDPADQIIQLLMPPAHCFGHNEGISSGYATVSLHSDFERSEGCPAERNADLLAGANAALDGKPWDPKLCNRADMPLTAHIQLLHTIVSVSR